MSESLGDDALLTLGLSSNNTSNSNQKGEDHDVPSACNVIRSVDSNLSVLFLDHENGKDNARLVGLLFEAASAAETHDISSSIDTLQEIQRISSLTGNPIQRVAAYFSAALAEILYPPMKKIICHSQQEEFLAFIEFYRVLPLYQFAHFTANQEIIEAFEEEEAINGGRIHVIDFDVSYGFQWPSLIQSLSDMVTTNRRISLTLTGYGINVEELAITKERLESFANGCPNLSFKFEGILRGSDVMSIDFRSNSSSTLVVNMPFYLQSLKSSQEVNDTLAYVHSMNPSMVILIEKERYRKARSFLSNFMQSLHFYAAIFDSLHEFLPLESVERVNIEKNFLGKAIRREIGDDHDDDHDDGEHDEKPWKETLRGIGFEGKLMSFRSLRQAKLLLNMKSPCGTIHGTNFGFEAFQRGDGCEIALSWRDRVLVCVSCWRRRTPP